MATRSGRQHCRNCSALAGMTRDLCDGCRMADVRSHIVRGKVTARNRDAQTVQEAYGVSVVVLPQTKVRHALGPGMDAGVNVGLQPPAVPGVRVEPTGTLADAQRFAATLGAVPPELGIAAAFYGFNRRQYYSHVRALLRDLDGRKRLLPRRRDGTGRTRTNAMAQSENNRCLSMALRLLRIYMQEEIIPLALKLDCSKTQVWHLEGAENVVQDKWVQRYASVFKVEADSIYRFAASLNEGDAVDGEPKDCLRKFAQHVLGVGGPPVAVETKEVKYIAGADYTRPRPRVVDTRTHPGTGYPMNKALGESLRYFRTMADMEVPEFAATAGISPSHVYNLERDRKHISQTQVERYARTLGCEVAHLWKFADHVLEAGEEPCPDSLRHLYEDLVTAPA